ncbi:uncharacterized protein EV422DRAFT_494325 [Fimicolochytrium jonesii]|uniref:uncharacterized protein n=1 Tax=Fimicolochytrium jonesii TaxID=1396493 RepID=UPI0022FDC8BB|nr:uncharacterized protein EV422DRAFT_494325 [Fimicolochytrium jonesii]KAI8823132.1 hypothetical protein EV422DRAFT_494325 [Fimicolochytrium jonesii]
MNPSLPPKPTFPPPGQSFIDLHTLILRDERFPVVEEKEAYRRYLSVWNRKVRYPDGRVIDWDVVGHDTPNPAFSVVFPFDTQSKTTCLIIEYAQGTNDLKYTFAAGGFDQKKHQTILDTSKQELSEEMRLTGGEWISLLPQDHDGIGEVKWSRNRFIPFLVLDPVYDEHPRARDAEELIEIRRNVDIRDLKDIILRGEMMLPSVQTAWMGLDYLEKGGFL